LQDPLPIDEMYDAIPPNPNCAHQLTEYKSLRGESNLESFHFALAHYGNCGMRHSLADNLNLAGTARHNLTIRHKRRLRSVPRDQRAKIPAGWEKVVPFWNHSELAYVNRLATRAGIDESEVPFQHVETLVEDTGERFFSEYLTWLMAEVPGVDPGTQLCLCNACDGSDTVAAAPQPPQQPTNPPPTHAAPNKVPAAAAPPPPQKRAPLPLLPANNNYQHGATALLLPTFLTNPYAYLPAWFTPVHYFGYFNSYCCDRYREYCFKRGVRGRIPHHKKCLFRMRKRKDIDNVSSSTNNNNMI
jgi:hypothetical protein